MNDSQAMLERSMRSVFVGNIPFDLTEERLKEVFSEVGPVLSFKLVYDRENGKPKGYGFCEYKDIETANSAMRNLNGFEIGGRVLKVDNAANEKTRMELQNSMSEPFVENAFENIDPDKVPEAISKAVASLPPEQMFELMKQMKQCIQNNPNEARTMLLQNPQLAYGLLQSLVVMKIVDPEIALTMLSKPNNIPDLINQEPRPGQPPPMRSDYMQQQQQQPPMGQMGGMNQMSPMGNDVERPMDPRARMMGGPQQSMMGGPQQSMMGGPQQSMMGGPQQPMMGGPQQPMMGGPQQPMMGGPQQPMMGGPQQPMMGGPQQPMMGGPQQPMMGGPQQPMMGGPQQPLMGGPQQPMMGGSQPPLPSMGMVSGDVDLRTQLPMPVPAPVMPPLPHNAPMPDQIMRDPRQPPLPVAPPRDPRAMDPRGAPVSTVPPLPRQPPLPSKPPQQQSGMAGMAGMSVAGMMGDGVSDQEKAALIMQVLQLTNEQIAMLPAEQRQSILMLKEQIAKSSSQR